MACFYPLTGWRSHTRSATGKYPIVFNPSYGNPDKPCKLPCGQCTGCRLDRSREWAARCVHEAQLHEANCFVTLTYNDDHLPEDRSLNHYHFQKFMKKVRKKYGPGVRYYMCGEYGDEFQRPHYHAALFNLEFKDQKLWKINHSGNHLYTSETLTDLWSGPTGPIGYATVGALTFQSAAYIARYVMKKLSGKLADEKYPIIHPYTGEIVDRQPEYNKMSLKPGIGQGWLEKYAGETYPSDYIIMNGSKMRVPKAYDRSYEILNPHEMGLIKAKRKRLAKLSAWNNTDNRLAVREAVLKSKLNQLKRPIQ